MSAPIDLFRRVTTGVYVVGVTDEGRSNAFTAAWVTQVSFEPLLVALSVNRKNASYALLKHSGTFVLNVLRRDQLDLARHFGTQSGSEVDKLAGYRWRRGSLGAPILQDAAAYLECRMTGATSAGDHEVVLARAIRGEVMDNTAEVMVYAQTGNLDGSSELYPASFEKGT